MVLTVEVDRASGLRHPQLHPVVLALAALAAGITTTLTPASQLIGLQALPLRWLPAVAGLVVIATAAAYAAMRIPLFARRL